MAKVENMISRVLDFTGMKKLNALLDMKRDMKDHGGNKGTGDDGYKKELGDQDAAASMLDLQSALRTIPREDDSMYPESPLLRGLGKAARILGVDEDEQPHRMSNKRASKALEVEDFDSHSLALDDVEVPPGAARRHFCSALSSEDDAYSLFPATRCCWGGDVGPTYLDHTQDIDQVSLRSSIAPSPVKAYKPTRVSSAGMTPLIAAQPLSTTDHSIAFGYYGRDRTGWARQKPYPYMMERDVEQVDVLAGRDAIEQYSRYPAMPKRQLVN